MSADGDNQATNRTKRCIVDDGDGLLGVTLSEVTETRISAAISENSGRRVLAWLLVEVLVARANHTPS